MNYQQALDYIHSLKRFGEKPGLERMRALMKLLGDPQEQLRCVHVAGTNGKGSVCALIAGALGAAGYRTGLYTSPFVVDFRERMQIDGEMIPEEELAALVERVRPLAQQVGGVTEFEFVTAVGFCWFAQQKCQAVVLETGLGGRFDATNVITKPLLAVITPIGLDHTAVLGDTIGQIASEKCGIIKPGVRVVTSGGQDTDALAVILEEACKHGAGVVVQAFSKASPPPQGARPQITHMGLDGTDFCYSGFELHIALPGRHQIDNALTAFTALEELSGQYRKLFSGDALARGFAAARLPGRMEVLSREPLTVLDGAHNPQGALALAQALEELLDGVPVTAVMGVMADKDSAGVLEILAPRFARLICVTPENPRSLDAHALAQKADALGLRASAAHSVCEALELAGAVAASEGGAVVICGSLYLAGEVHGIMDEQGDGLWG